MHTQLATDLAHAAPRWTFSGFIDARRARDRPSRRSGHRAIYRASTRLVPPPTTEAPVLRPVEPDDIAVFFDHQDDPVANAMAAFPARDRAAHDAHWKTKVLAGDDTNIARTIVDGDQVVGNIVSWVVDGERNVGYWIGRQHWGLGHATRALTEFVAEVHERPLHARVAEHNAGSLRVLAKCGFTVIGEEQHDDDPVKEIVVRLDA
ncbi:MAG: GNAT family N-acetyltransferase [Propionibacteriales bacterium]|nr:GNAT family N-acetyltransferase [Propionibacteriales bacterium]